MMCLKISQTLSRSLLDLPSTGASSSYSMQLNVLAGISGSELIYLAIKLMCQWILVMTSRKNLTTSSWLADNQSSLSGLSSLLSLMKKRWNSLQIALSELSIICLVNRLFFSKNWHCIKFFRYCSYSAGKLKYWSRLQKLSESKTIISQKVSLLEGSGSSILNMTLRKSGGVLSLMQAPSLIWNKQKFSKDSLEGSKPEQKGLENNLGACSPQKICDMVIPRDHWSQISVQGPKLSQEQTSGAMQPNVPTWFVVHFVVNTTQPKSISLMIKQPALVRTIMLSGLMSRLMMSFYRMAVMASTSCRQTLMPNYCENVGLALHSQRYSWLCRYSLRFLPEQYSILISKNQPCSLLDLNCTMLGCLMACIKCTSRSRFLRRL